MDDNRPNYKDLQERVDKVIGKIGLEKTLRLLDNFINYPAMIVHNSSKTKLAVEYLQQLTIVVFDLNELQFLNSNTPECKEARMITFRLLKNHCSLSHSKIAEYFNTTKRSF